MTLQVSLALATHTLAVRARGLVRGPGAAARGLELQLPATCSGSSSSRSGGTSVCPLRLPISADLQRSRGRRCERSSVNTAASRPPPPSFRKSFLCTKGPLSQARAGGPRLCQLERERSLGLLSYSVIPGRKSKVSSRFSPMSRLPWVWAQSRAEAEWHVCKDWKVIHWVNKLSDKAFLSFHVESRNCTQKIIILSIYNENWPSSKDN